MAMPSTAARATSAGSLLVVRHKECGAAVHAVLQCEEGHEVRLEDSVLDAGPGVIRTPGQRADQHTG
ncbi:hypothetical protein [Streptomyces sp. Ru72]|uniref:hypothetical protein n=1 Tax=Streptomyces sp. Ru72 TaxID=2080747 RepID=UPI0015E3E6D8|nr:hypothetical protein [Streptomyces sp. Ru72]